MTTNFQSIAESPENLAWYLIPYECEGCVAGKDYCRKLKKRNDSMLDCIQVITAWLKEDKGEEMSELKPCPFCGNPVRHEGTSDGLYVCDHKGCNAYVKFPQDWNMCRGNRKAESESRWNTRYREICHIIFSDDGDTICSNCLNEIEHNEVGDFCIHCGAEIRKREE